MTYFKTKYGYFNENGDEFIITTPKTPLPWVNVICPNKLGVVVAASGDGFTWYEHAGLNMITRWIQDFSQQNWGKFIYLLEQDDNDLWSASYSPCKKEYEKYEVTHGIGYTIILQKRNNIETKWLITVDPETNVEFWNLEIKNCSQKEKNISVIPYLEWCLGQGFFQHRQIHECFFKTRFDKNSIFTTKNMWEIKTDCGKWNVPYKYTAFFASNLNPAKWQFSKNEFIGNPGNINSPQLNFQNEIKSIAGSNDTIASMIFNLNLKADQTIDINFILGVGSEEKDIKIFQEKLLVPQAKNTILKRVKNYWNDIMDGFEADTPDHALNILVNKWLKYQIFSSRIFGRAGYYIQGGVFGYREIQDLLVVIPLKPEMARQRLLKYAQNQYSDLSIPHHFDELTGEKGAALWSDDMLWLPFITVHYIKETGDYSILDEKIGYLDKTRKDTYYIHCIKGIKKVLNSRGKNNLPLIKEGDWNDGLSAVGIKGRGESVWLGHFLAGVLRDFIPVTKNLKDDKTTKFLKKSLKELKEILNTKAWDGNWYKRAICDNGKWIGTKKNKEGKIYLNSQVWAILHDVIDDKEKLKKVLNSLEEHLYSDEGPLLLAPAYTEPDPDIGYLTRYNPGVRENGGVYVHAANWALQAEAKLGRIDKVQYIYEKICPVLRYFTNPEQFMAEPYVTSGNIEYAPSPFKGKGGWTWYTSSGSWFYKVLTEWMVGIRPEYHGLEVCPVVIWDKFKVKRMFRGKLLNIEVEKTSQKEKQVYIDNNLIEEDYIPYSKLNNQKHDIKVLIPKS